MLAVRRKPRLPTRGFIWVPAKQRRQPSDGELDAAVIAAGCFVGMAILLVVCWIF
jgi:hypothetical protein